MATSRDYIEKAKKAWNEGRISDFQECVDKALSLLMDSGQSRKMASLYLGYELGMRRKRRR